MKNIIFLLCSFALISSCNTTKKAQATATATPTPVQEVVKDSQMTFDSPDHDFGTMKVGEQKTHVYTFTNTFSKDITVELISGCHCTDIVYDEGKTYKPGEKGTISATFDSNREEERGVLNKTIDILLTNTNAEGYQVIKEVRFTLNLVE